MATPAFAPEPVALPLEAGEMDWDLADYGVWDALDLEVQPAPSGALHFVTAGELQATSGQILHSLWLLHSPTP